MRIALLLFVIASVDLITAQPYAIGTTTRTFTDAARSRAIGTLIHYPALVAGSDAEVADGSFPVLVHGHGFVMGVEAYTNLRDHFVPKGYILVLPTTEGGLTPDHGNFGLDLAFLAEALQADGTNAASPFFGHVAASTALMGHSMGGGASFLGAAGNGNIQALVNFAAAETDPSAIAAASEVLVPTLVFAATEDCVVPPANGPLPMYDALDLPCKAYVNVIGGGHCYFGANSFTCSFGELTCGPDLTISREEQHDVVNDLSGLWLDHFLKDDGGALPAFRDSLLTSTRILGESTCITTGGVGNGTLSAGETWSVSPVPAADHLRINGLEPGTTFEAVDLTGRTVLVGRASDGLLDVGDLPSGLYRLHCIVGGERMVRSFLLQR
ncbi:MAG: hypothetical protein JNL43_05115 [Flavobacteriales bacterium]|nr:hypothetical protein [Flavobacteriales bacterium]